MTGPRLHGDGASGLPGSRRRADARDAGVGAAIAMPEQGDLLAEETPAPRKQRRARKESPLTEGQLVARLRKRYESDNGNGPGGCVVPQVRNQAGFDSSRTIDALGFHFWPSRGLLIDAYECKTSRPDWIRELDNPQKADTFAGLVDRFYVVVGRVDLAKVDEVPPDWGLLVPHGNGLKEIKPAVVLHAESPAITGWAALAHQGRRTAGPRPLPPGFNRSFLVALIRQAFKVTNVAPEVLREARAEAFDRAAHLAEERVGRELGRLRALDETVREFEAALGYSIRGHRQYLGSLGGGNQDVTPTEVGKTLRAILDGDANVIGLRNRLGAAADNAERLAEEARRRVTALDAALTESPPLSETARA